MVALNSTSNDVMMHSVDGDPDENLFTEENEEGGLRVGDIYIPPPTVPYCSSESKGPRLMITDIYIENFKSYAGKVQLGPFHHCFTSIIGPNGNGKSNVIDAMLFVFGYRAQKIRAKKISALLHQSSAHQNVTSCSVYVHFVEIEDQTDDTYNTIPNTEFIVSRTAHADNSSYYCIDGKKVHFKEVAKVLKKHNIDLEHNRFLILQGEVESISMMKPKAANENECGLLEYLEDIVGTSRYKEPLVKISEKTVIYEKEHTEKLSRCRLVEKELQELESPMEEAVAYLKLKNDWTTNKNIQYQLIMEDVNTEVAGLEVNKQQHCDDLEAHEKRQEELQKEKKEKEEIVQQEMAKKDHLISKHGELQNFLKNANTKQTTLECTIQSYNKERKTKMKTLESEKEKLGDLDKLPEKNKIEIAESESKIEKLQAEKQEHERTLNENIAKLPELTQDLIKDKEGLEKKLVILQKRVDETKSDLGLAESEMKICTQNESIQVKKYEAAKESFDSTNVKYEERMGRLKEIESTLPGEISRLKECQEKVAEDKEREAVAREELQKCRSFLNDVKNNMQASQSQNKVINALMGEKKKGTIPGVLGRLGDLGGIDVKYDVAISTCCGRLDNVVVDTVDTAQACIEYLKKYNVGRASFIALEKIQHLQRYCEQRIQYPENVSRLFDLVNVEDERVRVAFYFALRETLVATDLEQGTRIAYGSTRYRVVTLRGDLIETSGTMSGGGKTVMRNRMGRKVTTKTVNEGPSEAELKEYEKSSSKLQIELEGLQKEIHSLNSEISRLKSSIQSKSSELKRLEIELKGLKEQLPHLEEFVKKEYEKMQNTKSDAKKVAELKKVVDEKKQVHAEASEEAKEISVKVDAINSQINQIQNTKIKAVKKNITNLEKSIEKLSSNVSKLSAEINAADRNKRKAEQKIANLEEQIKDLVQKIQDDCATRDELENDIEKLTEEIQEVKKELDKTQNEALKVEIEKIKKELNAGKSVSMDLNEKINVVKKKIAELSEQIPMVKRKIKELKYMEIPNTLDPTPVLQSYSSEQLKEFENGSITYKISIIEEEMRKLSPNLSVIEEFKQVKERFDYQQNILNDAAQKLEQMRSLYDTVYKKRRDEFMDAFRIISQKLKKMYQMITFRGDAELELADSMNPFSEGIHFSVRPPKKSWKMISNLSGGEKTLASLALVFALHYYKPSPLYVMDEIDAALDFKNVSIVANYIKTRAKNSQFIIISLRPNMFELSDYLVGIYKVNDCTNALVVKNTPPLITTEPPPSSQNFA